MIRGALRWLEQHRVQDSGIAITSHQSACYPEVTGYAIPTLLDAGKRELAHELALWLTRTQRADGSFAGAAGDAAFAFDTGQVLRGWVHVLEDVPSLESHVRGACDWLIDTADPTTDRLRVPAPGGAWSLGGRGEVDEAIHLYALAPIVRAGELLNEPRYTSFARHSLAYYLKRGGLDAFTRPNALTHFYGYVQEALLELGCVEEARAGMRAVEPYQQSNGAVTAYADAPWVCSTGLAQLALVWLRLEDLDRGTAALRFLAELQNPSGGFFGSYGVGADYFPAEEISWAAKFAIDASLCEISRHFDATVGDYDPAIRADDGRVRALLDGFGDANGKKVLDAGCGIGRYVRVIRDRYPAAEITALDVSPEMLDRVPDGVETVCDSLLHLPFPDRSFDRVLCAEALEHVVEIEDGVRELARVLAPGGTLVLIDKNRAKLGSLEIERWETWFDTDEVAGWLRDAGLEVRAEEVTYDAHATPDGLFVCWTATRPEARPSPRLAPAASPARTTGARRLRELFGKGDVLRAVGAHDALGARLAERAGFDAVWSSGLEISTSHCVPDANILTMSEFLAAAESMSNAVGLPIIADCDTGFGNSNNVIHTVRKFEDAGVAAVCIEDKQFPKVNSFVAGRQDLAPISEFVGKIMAAKNAQRDPDFMVIARVEALIAQQGLDEALRRANAYVDAGADAILIHSKSDTVDEIRAFTQRWDARVPLVVVPTTYFNASVDDLGALGARLVIYANHGLRAAIPAIERCFSRILAEGSTAGAEDQLATLSDVFELQGMHEMKRSEKEFLRTDGTPTRAIIPAAGDHPGEASMCAISGDIPMAMLDLNGRTLVERQIDALQRAGVTDVCVVGGHRAERIDVDGAEVVVNERWSERGIAASLRCAPRDFAGHTLMAFSDVLFESDLIERLKRSEADITLLASRGLAGTAQSRTPDLIALGEPLPGGRRALASDAVTIVRSIGKTLHPLEAQCEFVGIALLSEKGSAIFHDVYEQACQQYRAEAFQEARSVELASFTDVIQEIIDRGYPVHALHASTGWLEIHTFDDYRDACAQLAADRSAQ